MKSERVETVTVFEGLVTLAYPTGVSLIESELEEDETYIDDNDSTEEESTDEFAVAAEDDDVAVTSLFAFLVSWKKNPELP